MWYNPPLLPPPQLDTIKEPHVIKLYHPKGTKRLFYFQLPSEYHFHKWFATLLELCECDVNKYGLDEWSSQHFIDCTYISWNIPPTLYKSSVHLISWKIFVFTFFIIHTLWNVIYLPVCAGIVFNKLSGSVSINVCAGNLVWCMQAKTRCTTYCYEQPCTNTKVER